MTKLNCGVTNCAHNKEDCCCLNGIQVDGVTATTSCDTHCASYMSAAEAAATNSTCGCSCNPSLEISCYAEKCMYNSATRCTASNVIIKYSTTATECDTFKEKK